MLSSAARLVEIIPDPSRTPFRDWPELFGFIAESVFTFIPESCSGSPRNTVRNHPGIAFTFLRIPQPGLARNTESRGDDRCPSQLARPRPSRAATHPGSQPIGALNLIILHLVRHADQFG